MYCGVPPTEMDSDNCMLYTHVLSRDGNCHGVGGGGELEASQSPHAQQRMGCSRTRTAMNTPFSLMSLSVHSIFVVLIS